MLRYKALIGLIVMMLCMIQVTADLLTVGPNQQFTSIQSAIDAAEHFDDIIVHCGIYNESIQILKPLNLYGEPGCTILTNSFDKDILTISANNCTISGFTIKNCINESYSGLYILSDGNTIINNNFINNSAWGIYIYHCSQNILLNNSFTNDGICMVGTKDEWLSMNVTGNTVQGNPLLWLKNHHSQTIKNSSIGQLVLVNCTNSLIENITISETDQGIVFAYTSNSTITDSILQNCRFGIRLQYAESNSITNNTIKNNSHGLYITHSDGNLFFENLVENNQDYGSYFCCNSKHNILSRNSFINNSHTAYDYFDNTWFMDGIGNYYSDYNGRDENKDGIGDIPYQIPPEFGENIDSYPIVDFDHIRTNDINDTPGFILILCMVSFLLIMHLRKKKRRR